MLCPSQSTKVKDAIKHIRIVTHLINRYEYSRKYQIILKGYIAKSEINCSNNNCYLKQYLKSNGKNKVCLYKHVEFLYEYCISKYAKSFELRI